ncbi:MAG TPA: DoxX family protein [Spongiibacteraceae bacterium]|nr:DoxX family protein [Spongiibacteraceae bacterium]
MFAVINRYAQRASGWLVYLRPLAELIARLYVARVFFLSGLSKIQDWETTLYLFSEEYHVPLLSPKIAAVAGTAGELTFSVLLALGIFTPLSAFALFVLNIVAFVSYYHALIETPAAWHDHLEWGIILALLMTARSGCLSLDGFMRRFFPTPFSKEKGCVA